MLRFPESQGISHPDLSPTSAAAESINLSWSRARKTPQNKICAELLRLPFDPQIITEINEVVKEMTLGQKGNASKHLAMVATMRYFEQKGRPENPTYLGSLFGMNAEQVSRAIRRYNLRGDSPCSGFSSPVEMVASSAERCGYDNATGRDMTARARELLARRPGLNKYWPQIVAAAFVGHYLEISGLSLNRHVLAMTLGVNFETMDQVMNILHECERSS